MRRVISIILICIILITSLSQILIISSNTSRHDMKIDENSVEIFSQEQLHSSSKSTSTSNYGSNYDKNHNKIHDYIEKNDETKQPVLVCYDHHPDDDDITSLSTIGVEFDYKCKYVNVVITNDLPLGIIEKITKLPGVIFIEPTPNLIPLMDVSVRAVKARDSIEYSPMTAWDLGYKGEGINIAVLDTGVDDGHPDFEGKFVAGADFAGAAGRITTKNGNYNPDDDSGHGTANAGIALGTGGTDGTYIGVAPEAKLIDVRVSLGRGGDLISALEWCIDHKDSDWNNNGADDYDGIDIISISIGGSDDSDGTDMVSQLVNEVVDAGIIVVTAIGNDGPNNQGIGNVAAADKVIAVGNLNDQNTVDRSDDELHSSSSRGPRSDDGDADPYDELKPDVVAPGMSIIAPDYSLMGQNANGYGTNSGSSMSCPHVSGICAMMLEANPNLRPKDIKNILHETAEAKGEPSLPELSDKYNYGYGYGSVDAYEAVKMAKGYQVINQKPTIIALEASPRFVQPGGQSTITTTATDPDEDPLTYVYQVTGGEITGTGPQVTWTAPQELGEYDITATVNDGLLSSDSVSITITVEEEPTNHPPVIDNILIEPTQVEPDESVTITVSATDPDGDDIFYEYEVSGGTIIGTGPKVAWTAPSTNGKYTVSITVNDGVLFSETEKVIITVAGGKDNKAPVIDSFTANTRSIQTGGIVKLIVKATDLEPGELDYSYIATGGQITGTGPNVEWTAPMAPSSHVIEVIVTDDGGLSDTADILIEVYQPNSPPKILGKQASPLIANNDGTSEVLFTATIDDLNGLDDIKSVTIDLSGLFGDESQKMYDNGKHGDLTEEDGIYSYSYVIPEGVSGGEKKLAVMAQDQADETAADFIPITVNAVSKEQGDEGILGGLPGFDGVLVILAFILIFIFITGKRIKKKR